MEKNILAIMDNNSRYSYEKFLTNFLKCEIDFAAKNKEVIKKLNENKYSLILAISGNNFENLEQNKKINIIKKIRELDKKTPIIYHETLCSDKTKSKAFEYGADAVTDNIYTLYRKAIYILKKDVMEVILKSMELKESRWFYDGKIGYFSNNEKERLSLVLPENKSCKYITGKTKKSGKQVIAAFPSDLGYNSELDIIDDIEKITAQKLTEIKGGYIEAPIVNKENKTNIPNFKMILYGTSPIYGMSNHEEIAKKLREKGLEAIVENK